MVGEMCDVEMIEIVMIVVEIGYFVMSMFYIMDVVEVVICICIVFLLY